jgi:Putative binding domain, N-terminal/Viral BACON domain
MDHHSRSEFGNGQCERDARRRGHLRTDTRGNRHDRGSSRHHHAVAGCAFSISPETASIAASGGTGSISVSVNAGCAWTAASNDQWLTIVSGAAGSGSGQVQYSVAPPTGPGRTATMTVAGSDQTTVGSGGGTATVAVTSQGGCAWTSTSNAPWIRVTSGATGNGDGSVQLAIDPNTAAGRAGTVTIAGRAFTINQGGACAYSITPVSQNVPTPAGAMQVAVTAAAGCTWTATTTASWFAITAGASGNGNGSTKVEFQSNSGPSRAGTATIAGQAFTLTQDSGCTFAVSAASQAIPIGGGPGSVNVTASAGCTWTAASNVPWISISSGSPGSGDGTVAFVVDVNATGAPRSGTLTIAGKVFTVNQG